MTTNVHHIARRLLAVDSRWSIDMRKHERPKIIFMDDVPYQKIVTTEKHIAMFAGYANVMQEWKLAICVASYTGMYSFRKLPTKGIALLLLDASSGDVLYKLQHNAIEKEASFAGTGAKAAKDCWPQCRDAIEVIEKEKKTDPCTGGTVRYYDYETKTGTLGIDGPYNAYNQMFSTMGNVIYFDDQSKVVPIADAAASDNSIHKAINDIQAGLISAAAPFEGMDQDISDEEKEHLFSSLEAIFAR